MAYKYFQDLGWRTATGKILRLRLILLKILNMMDIKEDLFLWFPLFLIKGLPAVVLICIQIIKQNKSASFRLGYTPDSGRITQANS